MAITWSRRTANETVGIRQVIDLDTPRKGSWSSLVRTLGLEPRDPRFKSWTPYCGVHSIVVNVPDCESGEMGSTPIGYPILKGGD